MLALFNVLNVGHWATHTTYSRGPGEGSRKHSVLPQPQHVSFQRNRVQRSAHNDTAGQGNVVCIDLDKLGRRSLRLGGVYHVFMFGI